MSQITAINGTPLSALTFGTMQFGGNADAAESEAMFEAACCSGITHFDCAHVYNGGEAERLLGRFTARSRERLIIATKVAYTGGAGRANILSTFDTSRQRLDTDVVDILYLHRFDPDTRLEESFEALADLQGRGQVRYIGVSNFAAWQVVKAQHIAMRIGTRIDIIQPMYSLVKRQVEAEILPMAQDLGIAVAPYSPLGGGLLTGKYAHGGTGRLSEDDRYAARYGQAWMHETGDALRRLGEELGIAPATLAVAWVLAHPLGLHPIISGRTVAQLAPTLAAQDLDLSASLFERITALSQTPAPATDRLEEAQGAGRQAAFRDAM